MDLREVAAELYAAGPSEFVSHRNAAAAGADRGLAKEIRALRKPSAAAAAVNSLVHDHGDLVEDVLAVGDRMREAFAARDRDEIRSLTQERQRLLHRVTSGLDLSPAVQREVEETLQAAVIDPAAAAAVRSGMLVRSLESTGVDQVDVTDAVALPVEVPELAPVRAAKRRPEPQPKARREPEPEREPEPRPEPGDDEESREPEPEPEPARTEPASERRERQRRLRAAERAVERARSEADALDDELDEEADRRGDLEAERDRLQRRLQRVSDDLAESRASERDLRARLRDAQKAVREAERELRAEQAAGDDQED